MSKRDIIIIGGGVVGLTQALCLPAHYQITLIERQQISVDVTPEQSARVYALNEFSLNLFAKLGLTFARESVYRDMHIWDAQTHAKINFSAHHLAKPYIGKIVEDQIIRAALLELIAQKNNIQLIDNTHLTGIKFGEENNTLMTERGEKYVAKCIIGADGARSWLREKLAIPQVVQACCQHAVITTVKTGKPHHNTAYQCFNDDNILAFLPLEEPHSSAIVWSQTKEQAQYHQGLDRPAFCQALTDASWQRLGEVVSSGPPVAIPLNRQYATTVIKPRVALIGDSAHTIHPLAGMGVNLGLRDVALLTERLSQAAKLGSTKSLRQYERATKGYNHTVLLTMEGIKKLFALKRPPLPQMRALGLLAADKIPCLNTWFMRQASGIL